MLTSKFDLYKREWLDLVFADRNKAYGAYDLRVHHGDYVLKALAIAMLGFTTTFVTISLLDKPNVVQEKPPVQVIPDIPIPKIKPEVEKPKDPVLSHPKQPAISKPAATSSAPKVATTRFVPPVVTNSPAAVDPPTISDLQHTAIGPETIKGDGKVQQNVDSGAPTNTGPGNGVGEAESNAPYSPNGIDVLPEPLGGSGAWSKFLQKNLRYPSTENQGRVTISFVVEKDGHLTDITVLKGISPELDNEALRVLKLSPAWKPGMQNGRPVRVKFTVPIVFQLSEQ
ncbi:TonB family protein [Mucilaginibacter sp. Bleaf8]|uniref:energy transducer TonB n=1 Tax=Mucilaginibacter sp. Bleaf8 TaxID=2834430 RepID=UPI001BCBCC20|nr:energy transducer TonB [Mucilaginibacter sp. Bleaf8]MBS7562899.1 TonB family protein [Mucilaginibacter sp. Bleaf8]